MPGAAPRRVLVTGGCGFLGSHFVRHWIRTAGPAIVLDDLSAGNSANLPRSHAVEFIQGSVDDPDAVARAARDIDLVVHMASVVGMCAVTRSPQRAFHVSDVGTRCVLEATKNVPVVLVSSSAVYGLRMRRPAREDDVELSCRADHPGFAAPALAYDGGVPGYACGKRALETLGARSLRQGRKVLVVRPFNVVGQGQSSAYGMVLPSFVEAALRGSPLVVYDDGEQRRAFSDVETFTRCLIALAARLAAGGEAPVVLNIGCAASTSVRELAAAVQAEFGRPLELRHVPFARAFRGKEDVRVRAPDVARLESVLGRVRWASITEIVRSMVAAAGAQPHRGRTGASGGIGATAAFRYRAGLGT
jgi:UDP-glucose 4-epimerase